MLGAAGCHNGFELVGEAGVGLRPDMPTSAEREEIREFRCEVFELRRANGILEAASVVFAGELDPHRPR